jgi:hypothetical protein
MGIVGFARLGEVDLVSEGGWVGVDMIGIYLGKHLPEREVTARGLTSEPLEWDRSRDSCAADDHHLNYR